MNNEHEMQRDNMLNSEIGQLIGDCQERGWRPLFTEKADSKQRNEKLNVCRLNLVSTTVEN